MVSTIFVRPWPFLALLVSIACSLERVRIDPGTGHFIAPDGRTMVFHGVNVVQKRFPWHPTVDRFDAMHSMVEQDMDDLRSWGLNVVRLGVMWPGVEPVQGQFNTTYLEVMHKLIDDFYKKGIYTIVDFHQDSFSEMWCGEGFPRWLVDMMDEHLWHSCKHIGGEVANLIGQCLPFDSLNISKDANGIPDEKDCLKISFDWYSRTPEVNSAWDLFYHTPAFQAFYRKMWKTVAAKFADLPGVLGYDLVNEPLNGNFFKDFIRIQPGEVDKYILEPMYTNVFKVIREQDPNAIAFYEPTPFPDTYPLDHHFPFGAGVHPTGFTTGAGADNAHQCLSYHIYSCGFASEECDRKGDMPGDGSSPESDEMVADWVTTRQQDARRVGGGQFLTEFGACSGSESCIKEIERVSSAADAATHSWAYWQFKYNHDITTIAGPSEGVYNVQGKLQIPKVTALSRTYAPYIAGMPLVTKYSGVSGAYRLRYLASSPTSNLLTEIFLNEDLVYKNGYELSIMNATAVAVEHNKVTIKADAPDVNVDVAILRSGAAPDNRPVAPVSGWFHSADGDWIKWEVILDAQSPGFEFSSSSNVTDWKMLRFVGDDKAELCSLELQGSSGDPVKCDLHDESKHNFLFSYKIQVWKPKVFSIHEHIDTIKADYFGPLSNKRVKFTWVSMSMAEVLV